MDQVDIQAADSSSDISATETLADTPETGTPDSPGQATQSQAPVKYVPFSNGKEKFKINGEEHEWDWDTAKRYAQLGRSGQLAMERAAATQKKAQDSYNQLLKAAETDPEGLLEILNPRYRRKDTSQAGANPTEAGQNAGQGQDPRDHVIQDLEKRYESLAEKLEAGEIEKERQAIATELDAACKQFPALEDPIYRDYVKAQYRRNLQNGVTDISIEDVAFHVAQQIQERDAQRAKAQKARLDERRNNAPEKPIPGAPGTSKKGMTLDDVKRLAGRM